MLKRNEFLWFFFNKGFGAKCKPTELALNFIQKQYFGEKKHISPSFQSNSVNQEKVAFKIFKILKFLRVPSDLKLPYPYP